MRVQQSWVSFCFILAGFGILSEPLVAQVETKPGEPAKIQSTQADSLSREEKARIALQMFQEGVELFQKQTVESLKAALEKFKQAERLFHELEDKDSQGWVWLLQGWVTDLLGEKKEALNPYAQALVLFKEVGNQKGEATTLDNIGRIYDDLGEKQMALKYYTEALPLYRTVGDRGREASTLNNIGMIYADLGEKQTALKYFNEALPLRRAVGDRGREATTLNNIGGAYADLGEQQTALKYFNEALPLYRTVGDRRGEATTLNNIGAVYNNLGEQQMALKYYTEALPIHRAVGNRQMEATTLNNIGNVYSELGEQQTALKYYTEALSLFRAAGDRRGEATTLTNIGGVYSALGERQPGLKYYAEALPIHRAVGNRQMEATTLTNIGLVYSVLGEKQTALKYYAEALPIHRAVGNRQMEATTLTNIGLAYSELGEQQTALKYYTEALSLSRAVGDRHGETATLNNIGNAYSALGEKQTALKYYTEALSLRRAVGDQGGEATTLSNIGLVYADLGEKQTALKYYAEALPIHRAVRNRQMEATTLNNIGLVYNDLGEKQTALKYFNEALPLLRVVGDRDGKATTLNNLMYVWGFLKNPDIAIFYGKQSVNLKQELRAAIKGLDKELQRKFLKTQEDTYRHMADLLIAQERFPEALQVLRMLKEDEYFEFVQKDQTDANWLSIQIPYSENELSAKTRLDTVLERFVSLTRESDELNRKEKLWTITETERTRLVALPDELKQAQTDYESVLEQITKDFDTPATETSRLNATKELTELQTALKTLNCVAVFTLAAEENCHTILVTPEQIVAGKTAISRTDLTEKVADFRAALTNPSLDPRPLGKEFYDLLVGPIAKALEETHTQTVMWSLDGTLRYLPPAALWDGKQYLAERFQMSLYTIEPKTLEQFDKRTTWTGLGLGVSEAKPGFSKLPGVQAELQGIIRQPGDKPPVGILTGNRLLNQQFTETAFRQQLQKKYPLVHIASHFSFKPGNESQSALLLGDGSLLSLTTIKQSKDLFGGVDLLALSACQTAMGSGENERAGAEIEGFGVLAQRQGARAVLATLWSVADDSTAQLMKQFYQIRQSNPGMSKAEALRQAQLKLLGVAKQAQGSGKRKPNAGVEEVETSSTKSDTKLPTFQPDPKAPYSHPYYWAPFILIGNWK